MSKNTRWAFRLVLVALCLLVLPIVSAQGPVARVVVTEVDPSAFPTVTARFRALDTDGRTVPGIQRAQVDIRDGETEATAEVLQEEDGPLNVHFVVEAGVSLDAGGWAAAREAIRGFGNSGWMDAGNATVSVSIVRGRDLVAIVPPTTDRATIVTMDQNIAADSSVSTAMVALSTLLTDIERTAPTEAHAVIFLTRQLESNVGYNTLVDRAGELDVPIYTALLRSTVRPRTPGSVGGTPTPPPLDELVVQLATDTHAAFTLMGEDAGRMTDTYRDVTARARQYVVTYRVGDNQSGTRNITIGLPGVTPGTISYDYSIEPPQVVIRVPDNYTRIARQMTGDAAALAEPTTQQIVADVGFGTNAMRRIRQATLLVDGVEADQISNVRAEGERLSVTLSWDMRSVAIVGDTAHTLVVEVVDELGMTDSASAEVTVHISAEPVPATLAPGVTATPPAPPPPPPPPEIRCIFPEPLCSRIERPIRANPVAAISLLVAFLALILATVLWIGRGTQPVQRVTQNVRRGIDRLTNRYRRAEVRAYLELLAGDGDVGHRYEIYGDTPIGRSRQNAELLFQQEVENSPISRLHCTVTDEEDHFMLRDEDSANGTYLNSERLAPVVPHRLRDGDIIELARVERGGVRLRFAVATPEDTLPPSDPGYTFVEGASAGGQDGQSSDQTRGRF